MKQNDPKWLRRMAIHRHNGLLGSLAFIRPHLDYMTTAPTTTDEARAKAQFLLGEIAELTQLLKTRRPGT